MPLSSKGRRNADTCGTKKAARLRTAPAEGMPTPWAFAAMEYYWGLAGCAGAS